MQTVQRSKWLQLPRLFQTGGPRQSQSGQRNRRQSSVVRGGRQGCPRAPFGFGLEQPRITGLRNRFVSKFTAYPVRNGQASSSRYIFLPRSYRRGSKHIQRDKKTAQEKPAQDEKHEGSAVCDRSATVENTNNEARLDRGRHRRAGATADVCVR